ncbi:MAG: putative rhamnosyl transferase [Pararhodobacter sp.]|nr:putative rhamnosyl transferase [Pararhodobacter sp.]
MQVLGFCRFSYPAHGGFQTEHETIDERIRFLYADERLEERFRIFEAFTLASLQAQTDPDFTLIVLIGEDMPVHRREQLEALLKGLPQARLLAMAPGRHRAVVGGVINQFRRNDGQPCIQFRMDDDDAVSRDFVQKTRAVANEVRPLIDRSRLTAIDFTQGHIAQPMAKGILAEPTARQYWVPSLSVVARPGEKLTVMNFNHVKLWRFMPTITLHDPDMYVRGISNWNDSGTRTGPDAAFMDKTGEDLFRTRYGICANRVREIYRGVP